MTTIDMGAIVERIKAAQTAQGISGRELARRSDNMDAGAMSRILAGKAVPDATTIGRIAGGLGVPVTALLGEAPAGASPSAPAGGTIQVRHADIHPSALNPRKMFDPEAVDSLAANIAERGLLQPLVVRPSSTGAAAYELAAGERRWRAIAQLVEAGTWPADRLIDVTVKDLTDLDMIALGLSENVQRRDMHPIEEGEAFAAYVDGAGGKTADLAKSLGLTQRWAQIRIALARRLSPFAKKKFLEGEFSLECAKMLTFGSHPRQDAYIKQNLQGGAFDPRWAKRAMTEGQITEAQAAFDLSAYTGEISEGDTPAQRYLLDDDQAQRLQAEAIEALKAKAAGKWAWVEVHNGYFHEFSWSKSKDRKIAGALVVVDGREKPRIVGGLLKPDQVKKIEKEKAVAAKREKIAAAGGDPDSVTPDDTAPTKALLMEARRRKTAAIRGAVATRKDKGILAMKIACLGMLGGRHAVRIKADMSQADDKQPPSGDYRKMLDRVGPLVGGSVAINNYDPHPLKIGDTSHFSREAEAVLWSRIDSLDPGDVVALFNTLVAGLVGSYCAYVADPSGDDPSAALIAQAAGVTAATRLVDDEWLKMCRKSQLVDIGIGTDTVRLANLAPDVEAKTIDGTYTASKLRKEISGYAFRKPYLPPELAIAAPDPAALLQGKLELNIAHDADDDGEADEQGDEE